MESHIVTPRRTKVPPLPLLPFQTAHPQEAPCRVQSPASVSRVGSADCRRVLCGAAEQNERCYGRADRKAAAEKEWSHDALRLDGKVGEREVKTMNN